MMTKTNYSNFISLLRPIDASIKESSDSFYTLCFITNTITFYTDSKNFYYFDNTEKFKNYNQAKIVQLKRLLKLTQPKHIKNRLKDDYNVLLITFPEYVL